MKKVFISFIHFYQYYISPALPPSCRYYPTCSTYTIQAIEKHGVILGIIMGFFRILRCNPFAKGGIDLVPEHFSILKNNQPMQNQQGEQNAEKRAKD